MSIALFRSNDCNIPLELDAAVNQNILGENRICISFLGCRAFVERHRYQGSNDNEQGLPGKAFAEHWIHNESIQRIVVDITNSKSFEWNMITELSTSEMIEHKITEQIIEQF